MCFHILNIKRDSYLIAEPFQKTSKKCENLIKFPKDMAEHLLGRLFSEFGLSQ